MKKKNNFNKNVAATGSIMAINLLGFRIKLTNLIIYGGLLVIIILGIWKYFYKQEKLKHSSITIGKVVNLGYTSGKRVGQPEVTCEFSIDGKLIRETYERKDLKLKGGDCVEIIFSIEDNTVSTINYDKGPLLCD